MFPCYHRAGVRIAYDKFVYVNLPTVSPFDPRTARTWAEISLDTIHANVRSLQKYVSDSGEIMAVVKADAYGHGAIPVGRTCAAIGVRHIAVATVAEAEELRQAGVGTDIYVLPPYLPEEADRVVRADLIPFISSVDQLTALQNAARNAPFPVRCFLAVDSGMGREGCLPEEGLLIWQQAHAARGVAIIGIATHFASADEEDGEEPTHEQIAAFSHFLTRLPAEHIANAEDGRGGRGLYLSLSNSPATLRFTLPSLNRMPGIRGYLYRAGLLLYGIEPYRGAFDGLPELAPALAWRVRVTLIKHLPAGSTIGYGRTHTLSRDARIATLAVGYADGLSRRLSNGGPVFIGGQSFPIVGRVSMDQCQIDVTDATFPVAVGVVATLIGREQTVLSLAETIGTTPHEPTCDLSRRVKRLYGHATRVTGPPSPPIPGRHR